MARSVLTGAQQAAAKAKPVGWRGIPDLVPLFRAQRGGPPILQAHILRWLLENGAAEGLVTVVSLAELARNVEGKRQSTAAAWHTLERRGLIDVKPADGERGGYIVRVSLPELRQLSLFAAPDDGVGA